MENLEELKAENKRLKAKLQRLKVAIKLANILINDFEEIESLQEYLDKMDKD